MADDILARENPFSEGSARFKMFARKQAAARAAAAEAAAAKKAAEPVEEEKESGFFSAFFGRGEAIDDAVEGRRTRQSTDSSQ